MTGCAGKDTLFCQAFLPWVDKAIEKMRPDKYMELDMSEILDLAIERVKKTKGISSVAKGDRIIDMIKKACDGAVIRSFKKQMTKKEPFPGLSGETIFKSRAIMMTEFGDQIIQKAIDEYITHDIYDYSSNHANERARTKALATKITSFYY